MPAVSSDAQLTALSVDACGIVSYVKIKFTWMLWRHMPMTIPMKFEKMWRRKMLWWSDEKKTFLKSSPFIILAAVVLFGVSISAVSAELTAEDKEHIKWEKEKVAILVKYQKEYGKIIDEWGAANAAAAPKIVGFSPHYAGKAKQVDSEMIKYFESTSFDATNRFKDNPGCAEGVKQFEPVLGKLKQGTITGLDASGSFGPMVLYRCALSAKVYGVTKKLEKLQAQKNANQ